MCNPSTSSVTLRAALVTALLGACDLPRTTPEPSSIPTPSSPAPSAQLGSIHRPGSLRPTFRWEPVAEDLPITYQLELATDAAFTENVQTESTSEPSFTPPQELPVSTIAPVGARYYWRVRACAAVDDCSPYSAARWIDLGRDSRDLNGDGFADVAVGRVAPGAFRGVVEIFFGGATSGGALDTAADGALFGPAPNDGFATGIAIAGDLNGDGFADLAVGAPNGDAAGNNAGAVYLYFGGAAATFDTTADAVLTGTAGASLGYSVAGAGDVDGDGYADLVAGAPQDGAAGRAYVFLGGAGAVFPALPLRGSTAGDTLGISVAGAGDVNGDGYRDLVIGARHALAGTGRASIFLGAPADTFDGAPHATLGGSAAGELFGNAVAGAGDVNGDGFDDVVIGAPFNDAAGNDAGRAYVFLGGEGRFDPAIDAVLTGAAADDKFGFAVAGAGDVNGDGVADLLIGAPKHDAAGADAGRAYLYLGRRGDTFDAVADAPLDGAEAGAAMGLSTAAAGDVNGDGLADLMIGAPLFGTPDVGRAYLYLGDRDEGMPLTIGSPLSSAASDCVYFGISLAVP